MYQLASMTCIVEIAVVPGIQSRLWLRAAAGQPCSKGSTPDTGLHPMLVQVQGNKSIT